MGGIDLGQRSPDPQMPVGNGEPGRGKPAGLEGAKHPFPGLGGFRLNGISKGSNEFAS